jgi:ribosome-associated protein
MIIINSSVTIPERELTFTASRSSGPGGQNVNKVSTKVTLRFDLAGTASLTAEQKSRVRQQLKKVINSRGCLVIHEESTRSQAANRKRAIEKFAAMIARALKTQKKRVPTGVSRTQKKRRLEEKKIMAKKKAGRRRVADEE